MKKYAFILAAFAATYSCQDLKVEISNVPQEKMSFVATMPGYSGETKTTFGAYNSGTHKQAMNWSATDKIDVYDASGNKGVFALTSGAGEASAVFTQEDEVALSGTTFYAIYPSGKALKTSSLPSSLEISSAISGYDSSQAIIENGYDASFALMTAIASDESDGKLVFRHAVCYFGLQIPADNISDVKLSFSNTPFQKRPAFDSETGAISQHNSGIKVLKTTTGSFVQGSYYYLCAIPKKENDTKLGNLTVTYTHNGVEKSITTSNATFSNLYPEPGMIYDLGCPPLPVVDPSFTAANVEIDAEDEAGTINFTVNDLVDGGTVTKAVVSSTIGNLELGAVSFNTSTGVGSVPFTCDANTSESAKTAVVRLTYSYNEPEETVTKDVTITQSGTGASENTYTLYVNNSGTLVKDSYFTTSGTSTLKCDSGGYFGVDSYVIGLNTHEYARKLDGSNTISFTVSAGATATLRVYAAKREDTKSTTLTVTDGKTKVINGASLTWTDSKADLYDSGVIALTAEKTYTFSKSGDNVGIFYVEVTETL